ncbi:MAG TPA: CoA ester lyase [Symbiobacteriaceae bacterium]
MSRLRRRSKLFTPGNRPQMFPKAVATDADMIVLDLEDAVGEEGKGAARQAVRTALESLDFGAKEVGVRINGVDTPHWLEDLQTVFCARLDAIHLPKVRSPREVWAVEAVLSALEARQGRTRPVVIIPTLESAEAIENARAIATCSPRVAALQFGLGDLKWELGLIPAPHRLAWFRTQVVLAARAAGIPALDTVFFDFRDAEGYRRDAEEARACGFRGKSCIHPSQVPIANQVFSPTPEEVAEAREILKAYQAALARGQGTVGLHGRMVDKPVADAAREVLIWAGECGSEEDGTGE